MKKKVWLSENMKWIQRRDWSLSVSYKIYAFIFSWNCEWKSKLTLKLRFSSVRRNFTSSRAVLSKYSSEFRISQAFNENKTCFNPIWMFKNIIWKVLFEIEFDMLLIPNCKQLFERWLSGAEIFWAIEQKVNKSLSLNWKSVKCFWN